MIERIVSICLQNCSVKIAAKLLTTRLQKEIPGLIDKDQTGFLKGRTIAENFVYAAEMLQQCHKRKVPTLVVKLDFAKAFDTVNWDCLMKVLTARGFPAHWCSWVRMLLETSRTAVLVNGCPGPWITCKRGLRQGDPMSPYLFLLVADVLQALIKQEPFGDMLRPPVCRRHPSSVAWGSRGRATPEAPFGSVLCCNRAPDQLSQEHCGAPAYGCASLATVYCYSWVPAGRFPTNIPRAAPLVWEAQTQCI